jgi:uncharacterized membrane protein
MTTHVFPPSTLATATGAVDFLAWILICGVVGLVAVIRVLRRPTAEWTHGMWSKIGWIAVILYVAIPLGGYPIPFGAIAAIWCTRRPPTARPAQLPYADGDTWGAK